MYRRKTLHLLFVLTMLAILVNGCATTGGKNSTAKGASQYVGFLSDYSKLAPETEGSDAEIYIKPGHNFKQYNKILLDPPRSGAAGILGYIGRMNAGLIVYVSCHPATLTRDAGVLVNELGYALTHAGVMDMFPHTAHVESMAVFEK